MISFLVSRWHMSTKRFPNDYLILASLRESDDYRSWAALHNPLVTGGSCPLGFGSVSRGLSLFEVSSCIVGVWRSMTQDIAISR